MSVDLELLTIARNYAVKIETEFKQARQKWVERFQTIDEELQEAYRSKKELEEELELLQESFDKLACEYRALKHGQ